jgi:hypothetical protein
VATTTYDLSACPCCGGTVTSPCCAGFTIPRTLHATLSNTTGTCGCLNGVTVTMTYNATGSPVSWTGTYTACSGLTSTLNLFCQSGNWLISSGGSCAIGNTTPVSLNCTSDNTFHIVFTPSVLGCCSGAVTITISY